MDANQYNERRRDIVAKFRMKKYVNILVVLLCGAALIIAAQFIGNIALRVVLSAVVLMIAVIFARVRAVTIDHAMQERLKLFEHEEPDFHANFNND